MEHLDGFCEQLATACLMVVKTGYVPENGAVCMALKGVSSSIILDWAAKQEVSYIPQ